MVRILHILVFVLSQFSDSFLLIKSKVSITDSGSLSSLKFVSREQHVNHDRTVGLQKRVSCGSTVTASNGIRDTNAYNQPINLHHSVLRSYKSYEKFRPSYLNDTGFKTPIVLIHGLLGSSRNFQSWVKLIQQKEIELLASDQSKDSNINSRDIICVDLR